MGAANTGNPLFPRGYVGGTVTISAGQAGTPQSLLALILQQLDGQVPGVGREVTLQSDASGTLYVGPQQNLVGPLSASNYAYSLAIAGAARTYRSSFPGNESPVGDLYVFMSGAGTFHVEIA